MRRKMNLILALVAFLFSSLACGPEGGKKGLIYDSPGIPTPEARLPKGRAATLPELIDVLYKGVERYEAALMVGDMGVQAEPAVPALIVNLRYNDTDVRRVVARALGKIGPGAKPAVPALIRVLQSNDYHQVRSNAAQALGRIGDASAVPALANVLYEEYIEELSCEERIARYPGDCYLPPEGGCSCKGKAQHIMHRTNEWVLVAAAKAIAWITGEGFPDKYKYGGYSSNEEGVPLVLIAAREWWEKEGQYQDWPQPPPEPTPVLSTPTP